MDDGTRAMVAARLLPDDMDERAVHEVTFYANAHILAATFETYLALRIYTSFEERESRPGAHIAYRHRPVLAPKLPPRRALCRR